MRAQTTTKRRVYFALAFWLLCLTGLGARLVHLQAFARVPRRISASLQRRDILPRRGAILTRTGAFMAVTVDTFDVAANPREVRDRPRAASLLSDLLQLPYDEILAKLSQVQQADGSPNYYVLLKKSVGESLARKIQAQSVKKRKKDQPPLEGVHLYNRPVRCYPMGRFAAQLVGYLNAQGQGVEGLEFGYNKELGGVPGYEETKRDAKQRPIPGEWQQIRPPVQGQDVVLTIDEHIQFITERALGAAAQKYKPEWVCAIVMRPSTGEVLAMSAKPDFDPSRIPSHIGGLAVNRAVRFAYEPGSTFKLVTASAAIERVPTWDMERFTCEGVRRIGKFNVRCWIYNQKHQGHGTGTLSDAVKNSCNLVICRFAQQMGGANLLEYARNFGFGQRTGVGLPREARGIMPKKIDRKDPAHLASISFGQAVMVTPIQLLTAVCAIANDGVMMQPHVVREIRTAEGQVVKRVEPKMVRRVIQRSTARQVTSFMVRVVKEGTGKPAAVPGYEVAGKTGSAQKVKDKSGSYSSSAFISSFVGFLPARQPELAILVVADEPKGAHFGSVVCGPVFREIAEKSMIRLKMEPTLAQGDLR